MSLPHAVRGRFPHKFGSVGAWIGTEPLAWLGIRFHAHAVAASWSRTGGVRSEPGRPPRGRCRGGEVGRVQSGSTHGHEPTGDGTPRSGCLPSADGSDPPGGGGVSERVVNGLGLSSHTDTGIGVVVSSGLPANRYSSCHRCAIGLEVPCVTRAANSPPPPARFSGACVSPPREGRLVGRQISGATSSSSRPNGSFERGFATNAPDIGFGVSVPQPARRDLSAGYPR